MRAGRLVTILRLLQTRGRMTAAELAAELEVSRRTVLRDIEALSGAGVPVYAVRGAQGGFELLGGTFLDLPVPSAISRRRRRPAVRVVVRTQPAALDDLLRAVASVGPRAEVVEVVPDSRH